MQECELINILYDKADKPCGRTTPSRIVSQVGMAFAKRGLPPIITDLSRGVAASLKAALSSDIPRAVRKALNLPGVVILAMELAVLDPDAYGLGPLEVALMGAELAKV